MSVNKYRPHVYVLPEDDANRQLANGFHLGDLSDARQMQVLNVAGGWQDVIKCFKTEHVPEMNRNSNRHTVLLIDFDEQQNRLNDVQAEIPERLKGRVFILGAWSEPEHLRPDFGSDYEKIGLALAKVCRDNADQTWAHNLLRHNASELERLRKHVRPFLFHGR